MNDVLLLSGSEAKHSSGNKSGGHRSPCTDSTEYDDGMLSARNPVERGTYSLPYLLRNFLLSIFQGGSEQIVYVVVFNHFSSFLIFSCRSARALLYWVLDVVSEIPRICATSLCTYPSIATMLKTVLNPGGNSITSFINSL